MKKIYALALALCAHSAINAQTTIVDDGFESYPTGPYFGGHWSNWILADDADLNIIVSTDRAASGTKSGYVGPQNAANGQDALLLMSETYFNGKITSEFKMFVPDGSVGYYNMQESIVPAESWGFSAFINCYEADDTLSGGVSMKDKVIYQFTYDGSGYIYAYADAVTNTWIHFKHIMDFDAGTIKIFVNDVEVTYYQTQIGNQWPGQLKSFGSYDFYSLDASDMNITRPCNYYIDDVKVVGEGDFSLGVKKIAPNNNQIVAYPNPTSDVLNITSKDKIQNVEVFNVVGQKVMEVKPNADSTRLNIEKLAPGVYYAKVVTEGYLTTKQFVVK